MLKKLMNNTRIIALVLTGAASIGEVFAGDISHATTFGCLFFLLLIGAIFRQK